MVDFYKISTKSTKRGVVQIYPKFIVGKQKDLMIRGGDFYAIWNEETQLWEPDEQNVIEMVDKDLDDWYETYKNKTSDKVEILHMWDADSGMIDSWHKYCQKQLRDNFKPLDTSLIFANQETKKTDYASKKLAYPLEEGSFNAYSELMNVLYAEEERRKIEWAIGAVVAGDSKKIQKFLVLYGPPGSGKSTILNIIQMLFDGYYSVFDAESLGSTNATFALEQFKSNPLVAISHDGDLSRIEKNTLINSLVSHEKMTVNEKHKSLYFMQFNSFLFMGTNKPVKITDAKSGIIRRLIDVNPTGNKLSLKKYNQLMKQIPLELGAIAYHCKDVYLEDPEYYNDYKPIAMMGESNDFFNFVEDSYTVFKRDNEVTLKSAWEMYKQYCDDAKVYYPLNMRAFKSELKNYFRDYTERKHTDDGNVYSLYEGFKTEIFEKSKKPIADDSYVIDFKKQASILDDICKDCPAQYANDVGTPIKKWDNVETKLSDLDTSKLHYLKVPENHIVIDFDIIDDEGNKCFEKNLAEASKWPKTYAELSKSGGGIHLHYIYKGDPTMLSRLYAENIEIKVFTGKSSLRRKLSKCNNEPVAVLTSGLPMKEGRKMINFSAIKSETALRTLIKKNLNKEYHGATKPSVDFIYKSLEDAYNSGMKYDVSDMHAAVLAFAASSTHQADYCLSLVPKMHFKSDDASEVIISKNAEKVFFDVEVFPNLLLVNYKKEGKKNPVVRMINPEPKEIANLANYNLIGFNCRRYDNHILYARLIGYTNEQIYKLSQSIINEKQGFFAEAYNFSYTDIYDYSTKKQSLKKWEIELGLHHQELGMKWDEPVPEKDWAKVAEYCDNDVISTEAVWNATQEDFLAREILADLAGMDVNTSTNTLTTRIIFGYEKEPQLIYTDLSKEFKGYKFEKNWNNETKRYDMANMYRGVDLGFGGYVYAEPGMYENVALLDVASLHPHSIINMNVFGDYTVNYTNLVDARVFIKRGKLDKAKKLFNGKLDKYLDDETKAKKLSSALKIAINSVYGLTSAKFKNPFRDPRNENNIVALRGALFMKTLQDEVMRKGFTVAHIKTDSIKIPNATKEIIDFCMDFAKKYGYEFEHEATYKKMCLVNDSTYIAKLEDDTWTATGLQFQIPYVFKTCFSKEKIKFEDMCETKEVKTCMYLKDPKADDKLRFIGKVGLFCPMIEGHGDLLVKEQKKRDGSVGLDAVTGTKGYFWEDAEIVKEKNLVEYIDKSYYNKLVDEAIDTISQYGDFEWFKS